MKSRELCSYLSIETSASPDIKSGIIVSSRYSYKKIVALGGHGLGIVCVNV